MDGSGFQGGLTAQRSFDVWKEVGNWVWQTHRSGFLH